MRFLFSGFHFVKQGNEDRQRGICLQSHCSKGSQRLQASESAVMEGMTIAAPSSASTSSASGPVLAAMVNTPAATPARTPNGAFSTTMASHGRNLILPSPFR